jgi:hypothetical protein
MHFLFASMNKALPINEPKLAAPGAGLPKIELMVARLMFGWQAKRTSREQVVALREREKKTMLTMIEGMSPEALSERVLIRRLRGLEDSSRYWSLLMVLDHLRIVNSNGSEIITALGNGVSLDRVADTAKVKPSSDLGVEVIDAFVQSCQKIADATAEIPDLETAVKFKHPWFGPLSAAQWHFMLSFHMRLHRRQMEAIVAGMGKK